MKNITKQKNAAQALMAKINDAVDSIKNSKQAKACQQHFSKEEVWFSNASGLNFMANEADRDILYKNDRLSIQDNQKILEDAVAFKVKICDTLNIIITSKEAKIYQKLSSTEYLYLDNANDLVEFVNEIEDILEDHGDAKISA